MEPTALPWEKVKKYINLRLVQLQGALADAQTMDEVRRLQGRMQQVFELQHLPEILAAMEGPKDGQPDARTPRQSWPDWAVEPSTREGVRLPRPRGGGQDAPEDPGS